MTTEVNLEQDSLKDFAFTQIVYEEYWKKRFFSQDFSYILNELICYIRGWK